MTKNKTDEQAALNNEKEFSLDEYRKSMPYWQRVSYSFNSLRWIVMQQKKDGIYTGMTEEYYKETDPEEKKRIGMAREEYWQNKTDLEHELRDYEHEKSMVQGKIDRVKHQLWINQQLTKGIPAKHILRCEYPGLEFREEIDASEIDCSYKDDYDFYQDALSDYISDYIPNWMSDHGIGFEKFLDMDGYFEIDKVPASGHFWYGEIRTEVFGNGGLPLNENIKIYVDDVRKDGKIIDTRKIKIEDCYNLESQKEYLMECGFFDYTDEYIECSLDKFVKETGWHIGLLKGSERIEDVTRWPAPNRRGSWIDEDGTEMYPCLWYGYNDGSLLSGEEDRIWNIDDGLDFWFSDDPESYLVEYDYDGHAGCYGGSIPDIEAIRKECPILLEEDDTEESIDAKVQAYCKKQYRKAHKIMKETVTKPEA